MLTAKTAPKIDLLIIDAYYMLFRSFSSTPPLTTAAGFPTGALHGFMGGLLNLLKELQPARVVLALEGGGTSVRAEVDENYKVQRKEFPDILQQQIPYVWKLCTLAGIPSISVEGAEADDVIASLCLQNPDLVKAIFTTDKDIISLTNEKTFIVSKDKGKFFLLESSDIQAKWDVAPHQIPELLKLSGDSIDNVPGVKGIGIKTATNLVKQWGSCEQIYANLEAIPEKTRKLLVEGKAGYELSAKLIPLVTSLSVDIPVLQPNLPVLEVMFDSLQMVKSKVSWLAYLNRV